MWQFKESVRGIGEACRAFETPVTGGNVSFYNEGPRGAVDPTPVIGMIGIIERKGRNPEPITAFFKNEGDAILLFGETREEIGGSVYLALLHGRKAGRPPRVDLARERALQRLMAEAAAAGWLASAHDCSDGGLAVALAESCLMEEVRQIGAAVHLPEGKIRTDALLFGESAGRIVVSCLRRHVGALEALAGRHGVVCAVIGRVGGPRLSILPWIDAPVDELSDAWRGGLRRALEPQAAA
jgi:phosphoribosylformylglycinamidine synthase